MTEHTDTRLAGYAGPVLWPRDYWGELAVDHQHPTRLYAYDKPAGLVDDLDVDERQVIPNDGACYGYVQRGRVTVSDPQGDWHLRAGHWWVTPLGCRLDFTSPVETSVVVAQRLDYRGQRATGGPIEHRGRLRYIDGCSDTLLACPPRLGDPCLNHLHFPAGISQTFHDHPSLRAGIVARGIGVCEAYATGETEPHSRPLAPGTVFHLPAGAIHRFETPDDSSMDVIAYHPDSDWGPTDEQHPMLNRTWVDGQPLPHDPASSVVVTDLRGC